MIKFIIGLILGTGIAAGLAYYINSMPSQFVEKPASTKNFNANTQNAVILAPGTKLREIASEVVNTDNNASAPTYDFYNILQGKDTASSAVASRNTSSTQYYIQAGAFADQDAADDMKARVALLGFDSSIKTQQQNDKIINRILIGPFDSEADADATLAQLDDNGIKAVLLKTKN